MNRRPQRFSSPRRRFLLGAVLLIVGACLLADNLGLNVSNYIWDYWAAVVMAIGAIQLAWPGSWDERSGGYWVFVIGLWGAISDYEWLGLHWGNSWPIFIIALGIRVLIDGLVRSREPTSPPSAGPLP